MTGITPVRWKYVGIQARQGTVTVMDMLMRKPRAFSVPQVTEATVVGRCAYATTGSQKVMKIDLESGTRQFLSANDPEFAVAFRALAQAGPAAGADADEVLRTTQHERASSARATASMPPLRSGVSAQIGFNFQSA